jgi:hypothetical protein
MEEGISDLAASPLDEAAERRPADPHPFGGCVLVQPLQIGQAQRLKLVQTQHHGIEVPGRNTLGLEQGNGGGLGDRADLVRSAHRGTPCVFGMDIL